MWLRKHKLKIQIKEYDDDRLLIYGDDLTPELIEIFDKIYEYAKKEYANALEKGD